MQQDALPLAKIEEGIAIQPGKFTCSSYGKLACLI
jgi:hypothetical protein